MCRRFSQWPISCVAVRPRLNGAAAVPDVPNADDRITTPSNRDGPPGNWAYPSSPPPRLHDHRFRYRLAGQAGCPPPDFVLTESSVPKDVRVVSVLVMPVCVLPWGSFVASANWMLASATRPVQTDGTLLLSGLVARKSLFSTAIWLLICASEMFSESFL